MERRLIGKDVVALDVPSKVNGKARYGLDAAVDGMMYARPIIPPTRYGSKVISIGDSAARRLPGYIRSLALEPIRQVRFLVADGFSLPVSTAANRAADLVKVKWQSGKRQVFLNSTSSSARAELDRQIQRAALSLSTILVSTQCLPRRRGRSSKPTRRPR